MAKNLWADNEIQFARLLSETMAALATKTFDGLVHDLATSMDLSTLEVCNLFDRAEKVWEHSKSNH